MSKPINQMEIGKELVNKLQPALMDFASGAPTRSTANTFALALRNADATAANATGFKGAKIENIMAPEQMGLLNGVGKDLARKATAEDMAKTTGSTTMQNLSGKNLLRQTLGPLGMPESFTESALNNSLARPIQWLHQGAEPKIEEVLAKALLDGQYSSQLMQKTLKNTSPTALSSILRTLPTAGGAQLPLSLYR